MIPPQFDYVRPGDLEEALRILKDREGEAKVLSGGYSLLPLLKLRLAQPELLVDIRDVAGLDADQRDRRLSSGSAAAPPTARSTSTRRSRPLSAPGRRCSGGIGDPQVRNWGTIGGSVAHADPASRLAGGPPRAPWPDRLPQRRTASG